MFDNMTVWKRIVLVGLGIAALASVAEYLVSVNTGLGIAIMSLGLGLIATAGAIFEAFRKWLHHRRSNEWRFSGCCPQCGYNLTGNTDGICPECGTHVEDPPPKVAVHEKGDQDYYDSKSLIVFFLATVGGILLMIFMPGSLLGLLVTCIFGGTAVYNALIVFVQAINKPK